MTSVPGLGLTCPRHTLQPHTLQPPPTPSSVVLRLLVRFYSCKKGLAISIIPSHGQTNVTAAEILTIQIQGQSYFKYFACSPIATCSPAHYQPQLSLLICQLVRVIDICMCGVCGKCGAVGQYHIAISFQLTSTSTTIHAFSHILSRCPFHFSHTFTSPRMYSTHSSSTRLTSVSNPFSFPSTVLVPWAQVPGVREADIHRTK